MEITGSALYFDESGGVFLGVDRWVDGFVYGKVSRKPPRPFVGVVINKTVHRRSFYLSRRLRRHVVESIDKNFRDKIGAIHEID